MLNDISDWLPQTVVDTVASLSFLTHFSSVSKGVLSLQDLLYFLSMIAVWLTATAVVVELKQAD